MFLFERDLLKHCPVPFARSRSIKFQDVDAAGVIFYPRLLEYFNDTYLEFLAHVGQPLHEVLGRAPWISPVRHAEADFLRPLRFGDRVEVGIVAARVEPETEPSEVTLGFRIVKPGTLEVATLGQVVHTFVDHQSFRRTIIPEPLLSAFRALGP